MNNSNKHEVKLRNIENPFTELFSLLRRYENLSDGTLTLVYNSEELRVMKQHINNAIDTLLHGLQDLGHLIGVVGQDKKKIIEDINNIGFFISAISNLTEALTILQLYP